MNDFMQISITIEQLKRMDDHADADPSLIWVMCLVIATANAASSALLCGLLYISHLHALTYMWQ